MHISHVETSKSIIEGLIKLFLVCARFDCEMPLKGKVYLWRRVFFLRKCMDKKILLEGFLGEKCLFFGKARRSFWNLFCSKTWDVWEDKEFPKWFVQEFWKTFRSRSTFEEKRRYHFIIIHYRGSNMSMWSVFPCSSMPLEAAFQKYDVDNSGLLEPMEFCRALHVAWWLKELCQTLLSLWWDWLIGMWVGVPSC